MLGSDLRPRVNDEGPKSTGVFFSQYDGSLPWEKKWPINDFNKFLGPESHDVNGFLSAINEEYFYE
jgi:hypothetical protein